jgi:hypothetical protein
MVYTLYVHLRRYEYEHAKDERNGKAFESFADVLLIFSMSQGMVGAHSGEHEEKRHDPLSYDVDENRHAKIQLFILDVPIHVVEGPGSVKKKNHQHCQHA